MNNDPARASLELLYHISRELTAALDLRAVLHRVLTLSIANVGAERGSMVVLDDSSQAVDGAIVVKTRLIEHTTQQLKETIEYGLAGWVVRNWKAALLPDTSKDSRWMRRADDALERSGAKSAICVPLMARQRLVGVLTVVHPTPGTFNQEHLSLMQAIADQAGIAVLNARLYEESQRQARVMTALAESAVAFNASLRVNDALQRILDHTTRALQSEAALLSLTDEASQVLVCRAVAGQVKEQVVAEMVGRQIPLGQGATGKVAVSGIGVVVMDAAKDSANLLPGIDVRAKVCAPVHVQGQIIGVLEAINPPPGNLNSEALLTLTGLGSMAGVTLLNAQLYESLEQAHKRYHELFDDSIDLIVISDTGGRILEVNRRGVQISGYSQETLLQMNIGDLHRLNMDKLGEAFGNLSLGDTQSYESDLYTHSGEVIPVEVHAHRIAMDSGNSLQWIMRDITERKRLATLQDDLIGMVYHDLRSPLSNIVSSLDLLNTMLPSDREPALVSVLSIANRSVNRVQRLVASLLDIRKLEAGQPITDQEPVDPVSLAVDAIDVARPQAESKSQTFESCVPDDLPPVWVDADMVRRVLMNLVDNATKYSPPGSCIRVGARQVEDWVEMWVEDSGPGIPESDRELIFDKFARLRMVNAPKGLGLGLAFCRLAVVAHGGRIWVEPAGEQGSRFCFTLPVAELPGDLEE